MVRLGCLLTFVEAFIQVRGRRWLLVVVPASTPPCSAATTTATPATAPGVVVVVVVVVPTSTTASGTTPGTASGGRSSTSCRLLDVGAGRHPPGLLVLQRCGVGERATTSEHH